MNAGLSLAYSRRYRDVLTPAAVSLERLLRSYCWDCPGIGRISARAKGVERFLAKAASEVAGKGARYLAPLEQIQDQISVQIVVFHASDVERVSHVVERYFRWREATMMAPDVSCAPSAFGKRYVLELPDDVLPPSIVRNDAPEVFELQIGGGYINCLGRSRTTISAIRLLPP